MRRARIALAAALACAGGCRAAPHREAADVGLVPPERWSAADVDSDARPPAEWWRDFGDARLDALVEEALAHNRDLGAAAWRVTAAAARARAAGAERLPTADLGASARRQRQNFIGLPIGGGVLSSTSSSLGVSLDVGWEVDLWGRLRAGEEAAALEVDAVAADLRAARHSLAAQTTKVWFALAEARQQLELARRSAASFDASAAWIDARWERGLVTALERHLAEANAADARANVASAARDVETTARQLEVLLGRYPAGELAAPSRLPPPPAQLPAGLPAELLMRRPDLVAARARLAALDRRVRQAQAALLPRLSLTGSAGSASEELRDLFDPEFDVWSLFAGLTAPLFQGGRLRAGRDAAEAERRAAADAFVQAALRAFGEVETTLGVDAWLATVARESRRAADEARAAETQADERYRGGLIDLVTLLEAQRRSVSGEARAIAAQRAWLDNRVDLMLALGGGPADEAHSNAERNEP